MNIKYILSAFVVLFGGLFLADRGQFVNGEINMLVAYVIAFISISVFGFLLCKGFSKGKK